MKKRTYIYAVLCLLVIVFVTINCTDEELIKSTPKVDMKGFTLEEAKAFFEMKITEKETRTRAGKKMSNTSLSPEDFTPKWNNAVGSSQNNLACYDMTIQTNTRYQVMSYDFKDGTARVSVVLASQKLVIVKDAETGALGQYILTLIPSKDFYVKHKNNICDLFINCSDKACFSGAAIYTDPLNGRIIRADRYVDGLKIQGVFMPGDMETLGQRVKVLRSVLEGMTFRRMAVATTRFGEFDYGDSYPPLPPLPDNGDWNFDLGDYTDLGDGFFYDNVNKKLLFDSNGDGKPDTVCVPEVEVKPDNPGEPIPPGGTDGIEGPEGITPPVKEEPSGPGEEEVPPPPPVDPNPTPNHCPLCGATGCMGECIGDLPQPVPPTDTDEPIVPDTTTMIAKKLFRNSSMIDDNWKALNRMIDKIMDNCMGKALVKGLLEELNGNTLTFQVIDKGYSAFSFGRGSEAGILLDKGQESDALFHEMWHAYQSFQERSESSYINAIINMEIEAHYAQYQYLQTLPEFTIGSKWQRMYVKDDRMMAIAEFDVYIDSKGNLLPRSTEDNLRKCINNAVEAFKNDKAYEKYLYDKDRSPISTFSNLRKLTKDC